MTQAESDSGDEADIEAGKQADLMKDQLRKDVASWSAARSGEALDQAERVATPAVKTPAPRAARHKAKPPAVVIAVPAEKKPFKMSYDGTSDRDYIAHRLKHGAR